MWIVFEVITIGEIKPISTALESKKAAISFRKQMLEGTLYKHSNLYFADFSLVKFDDAPVINLNEIKEEAIPTGLKFTYHQQARKSNKKNWPLTEIIMRGIRNYYELNGYNPEALEFTEKEILILSYELNSPNNKTNIDFCDLVKNGNKKDIKFMGIPIKITNTKTLNIADLLK